MKKKAESGGGAPDFAALTPDAVLGAVEEALGKRCSNVCRPLNSYINRVYEVGLGEGGFVVAKFYRPHRWSREALQDELDFVAELHAEDVPVIPPLPGVDGRLLHEAAGACFAVYPKKGGRQLDEPSGADDWRQLGRLLGRLHQVGARREPRDRVRIHPCQSTRQHLDFIRAAGVLPPSCEALYIRIVEALIERLEPLFDGIETMRIHGDCHRGNILARPGEPFHVIDFDDMAVGPPVQDLWMLLPGAARDSQAEMGWLLDGYETFRDFEYPTWKLIEPLRAMRLIHYTAWCARQKSDGSLTRLAPDWGTLSFWRQEVADLERQRQEIEDALAD